MKYLPETWQVKKGKKVYKRKRTVERIHCFLRRLAKIKVGKKKHNTILGVIIKVEITQKKINLAIVCI